MELWQLDVTASAFLADGREVKIVTGVDDHSRFCVLAKAVMRATARPVCLAFVDAMRVYGVPEEVLTDNGKVFTGRFHKPGVPVEVLFDKICRENGITHRLTKIHSPTTTGKIERLHQTLQRELLDVHGPFESIEALQAALDAWRGEYNTDRPHQSLGMAFPASRFTPASSALELRIPVQLAASTRQPKPPPPADGLLSVPSLPMDPAPQSAATGHGGLPAVEVDRVVPASGNLWIGGQQVWLGPVLTGRQVTLWADQTSLHVLLDGTRIKTLPSRLGATELARLAANGARPAGPSPLPAGDRAVIEVDRTVNASGLVSLGDQQVGVGSPLAGQRVTLRMEGTLDGCPRPRREPAAHHDLPGCSGAALPAAWCPRRPVPAASARRAHHRAAAGLFPGRSDGRPPEDPRRDDPRGQDRHRDLREQRLPDGHRRRNRRRSAPHHHQRNPPLQSQRHR
jgi:hypothetical protein